MKKYLILCMFFLTSCISEHHTHGYTFDQNHLSIIKVGQTNKEAVITGLGTPTTKSDFGPEVFYYISYKTEKVAFFDPKIIEQKVIAIAFDKKNVVADITEYNIDDLKNVAFSEHKIELKGNSLSPVEQILTNIGKFNKKEKKY